MKTIGFSINGVTRDLFTQFDKMYRRKYIKNEQIVKMDEYFRYVPEEGDSEGETARLQSLVNEKIKYPVDTYDLRNHYAFESAQEFDNFLNQDYVFEIYGSAPPVAKAMDKINRLQKIGEANNSYRVILFSDEEDQAIQATYHFLAKSACRVREIAFERDPYRIWSMCDAVVTDNPEMLESKGDNKASVKIAADYNQYQEADYEFKSVNDIDDSFFVNLFRNHNA